jgi:UDP-4-amino-4,6-dideoxy-N-acetyl-beta-L-altrosamine transaminase
MIPYGRQDIGDAEVAAVIEVLRSDWLTQGPTIDRFERGVADYCGAQHAVAVSNATAALHVACMAVGLKAGDLLWTSPNSFVASSNCGLYCGADIDFVDIDPRTYNMDPTALARKLEAAEKAGRLPKVVIPVHFSGQPCDMAAIGALAKRYKFFVIEDASHAVGAEYRGGKIGSCAHSDMAVFSFHPVKIMTTAEGGIVLTNNAELHRRAAMLRTHGITRDPAHMRGASEGGWYYEQIELGYNYRLTDIQAALGLVQLSRLDEFLARRRHLAKRYDTALADLPLTCPWQAPEGLSSWHLYVIKVDEAAGGKSRRQVYDELRAAGIGVQVHYIPIHLQPYYRALGFSAGQFPYAEAYYATALSLPIFLGLTDSNQDKVIGALRDILGPRGPAKGIAR